MMPLPTNPPLKPSLTFERNAQVFTDTDEYLPLTTAIVEETILPYYLSHISDGHWSKVEHAWHIYGRMPQGTVATSSHKSHSPSVSVDAVMQKATHDSASQLARRRHQHVSHNTNSFAQRFAISIDYLMGSRVQLAVRVSILF